MKVIEKIAKRSQEPYQAELPVIAFLGDSVTQGCFEVSMKDPGTFDVVCDQKCCYHSYVSDILKLLFPQAPVQIINAGISGDNTENGLKRIQQDVLRFHPDLTVVCFGLNDSVWGLEKVAEYGRNLKKIFLKLQENGSEIIYMTPNMMNTYVSWRLKESRLIETAEITQKIQNEGIFKAFLDEGKRVAQECGVTICDVYQKWELLYANGVDTTELLANYINHPNRDMNWLFAYSLVETMMQ